MKAAILAMTTILLPALPVAAETGTETLRLRNRSGVDLVRFFASPVTDEFWRDDLLGDYVLGSGRNVDVTIRNVSECFYDLLMMFADGAVVPGRVDVCKADSYTIEP
ncbi:hypothetical protein FHS00_000725 [Limimaricola variabilis]|jgi:hypothetical protein|uniref:Argininosuccinate lyase n=1 Tax=Limimaricola variabilis TaxID=1492771 RepID=A0ABR6HL22_9RHOB|nr:hypothetical protein [Limimaricola variabilis]MBB3711163.1 hypothetical protein [Limimaricola variabilis]WPY93853.1 hypothetical protein T8T21_12125 [Limimaricola variabilis]